MYKYIMFCMLRIKYVNKYTQYALTELLVKLFFGKTTKTTTQTFTKIQTISRSRARI